MTFIDEQEILISSGGNGGLARKYNKYLVDNIGVIHDETGAIDDTERQFGGFSDTGASDKNDWLILDFQSHELTESKTYWIYFESMRCHYEINTTLPANINGSNCNMSSNGYPIIGSFTFSTLNSSNIPTVGPLFSCGQSIVNNGSSTLDADPYSFELDKSSSHSIGTIGNLYGVIIKIYLSRDNSGGAIDSTQYFELLNDNIYIVELHG